MAQVIPISKKVGDKQEFESNLLDNVGMMMSNNSGIAVFGHPLADDNKVVFLAHAANKNISTAREVQVCEVMIQALLNRKEELLAKVRER